jgi:hypothetical protein
MSGFTHLCMTYQHMLCSAAGVHMGSGLAGVQAGSDFPLVEEGRQVFLL